MLKVLFFASVRERLQCSSLEVDLAQSGGDLDSLQEYLCNTQGKHWLETLAQDNIIRAVNQQVAQGNKALQEGDEIAFYPPVTGG